MTSVKIKFRPSKLAGREGALCIQLIDKRKIKVITTRFRIYAHEWNKVDASVRFDRVSDERRDYLQYVADNLIAEVNRVFIPQRSLNGFLGAFIAYQTERLMADNREKTASTYATAQRSFLHFLQGSDIKIKMIDSELIMQYELYLKKKGLTMNSISCYMRTLRSIYNQAVEKGFTVQRNPFRNVYTGIDKTHKRAVGQDVITQLKMLDLSGCSDLMLARDIFMFSFYTRGMSFVDMANLQQTNIQNGYIHYMRSKTDQRLSIKIEACIEEIIKRYQDQVADNYLLPIYTMHNYNPSSHLRTYNKRLKRLSTLLGLEKPLSSHVSRHSWATLALRKGLSVKVISEGMGHESEHTTRIYLDALDQSAIDKANAEVIETN
jgi:site-specific recombinase XerD